MTTRNVTPGIMPLIRQWFETGRTRADERRRLAVMAAAATGEQTRLSHAGPEDAVRERGWFALGAVSIAVLLLAVVVPGDLALAFAAIGFAGLVLFRLTAAWVGWVPHRRAMAPARGYSETRAPQREATPQVVAWRSNSIRGRPPRRPAHGGRNGTSSSSRRADRRSPDLDWRE